MQRTFDTEWGSWTHAPDVVLTPYDAAVTVIDTSGSAEGMQIHEATLTVDPEFADRRAVLLFNAGTSADLVMPDGSIQPAPELSVRATEYTVGDTGPSAMPGNLPPTSQYTYAFEASADEAIAAGAKSVQFDQPVIVVMENIYGFAPRSSIPAGASNPETGLWEPAPDGFVIAILSETNVSSTSGRARAWYFEHAAGASPDRLASGDDRMQTGRQADRQTGVRVADGSQKRPR